MRAFNDSAADNLAAVSGISAVAHFATEIQPIISATAGSVAILSGIMAFIYHLVKTWKKIKE
jgi:hypothetical protein